MILIHSPMKGKGVNSNKQTNNPLNTTLNYKSERENDTTSARMAEPRVPGEPLNLWGIISFSLVISGIFAIQFKLRCPITCAPFLKPIWRINDYFAFVAYNFKCAYTPVKTARQSREGVHKEYHIKWGE